MWSWRTMSSRTRSVAVAVSAMKGTPGKCVRRSEICRYSGRKSWPHSEMQCASSIAMSATFHWRNFSKNDGTMSRSGAT